MQPHRLTRGSSHAGTLWSRLFTPILCACALALPACDDPQTPVGVESDGYRAVYDPVQGALEFRLESPTGVVTDLRLVATQLTFDAEAQEVHAWIAVRNASGNVRPGPASIEVRDFAPASVWPVNADCPPTDCLPPGAPDCALAICSFDHSGTYGSDGVLEPGEMSEPVEWILHNPTGESFAFRARLGKEDLPAGGAISGVVFADRNGNGRRENDEPGIAGAGLALRFGDAAWSTQTDASGHYRFAVQEPGLYQVFWRAASDSCNPTTPQNLEVVILRLPDGSLSGFEHADFGCQDTTPRTDIPLTGFVYVDVNQNGQRDLGEIGVPGVLVVAAAMQCPTFAPVETHTDQRGQYALQLPDCDPPYVVHHAPLPGFVDTSPNPLMFERRPPQGSALRGDFGVMQDGSMPEYTVDGVVFLDANRNGMRDRDESGVPNVEVTASGLICETPLLAHTRTDALGRYVLRGADVHCPLPWLVQRHGPWIDTTPNPVFLNQPPPEGSFTFHLDFGVVPQDSVPPPIPLFAIEGFVFADLDGDGLRSRGEPGIADAEVQLLSPCDVLRLVRTDMMGNYRFPPDVVAHCPVEGVWQSSPEFVLHSTPNPVLIDPNTPPGAILTIHFGVVPTRAQP